mmetsp:Transcript_19762/g.33978  ORF Transcript_19762/g.33978 Transcript_19762/m.33978 type:complete len:594 (+) Transcript_19762:62-1843(+)|eukprot:CAMPEP_0196659720 /NCGR_PEP_ID=MMETSP1086-20130531/36398_1 /TAXON_ID=77921 /ORGANISM="Cyanoptyche  gloeocystis , Strain SAG4.97" /LENGTH=593 /DNA_ID=CAMNT_0041993807 /DNA_START=62 /DNA_END=1843 /DNA_ORIENTATION=+
MPTVNLIRDELFAALGKTYTDKEFDELCFQFGIELDEVTSEKHMVKKEKGETVDVAEASDDIIYKIEVPANRYDLLCLEGLSLALNVFNGKTSPPVFRTVPPAGPSTRMTVLPQTAAIRPFVVCAILRNITFTPSRYQSFIDLQDKLHQNICRKRTLVAIGTHDLDTVQGAFTYEALPPDHFSFVPLNKHDQYSGRGIIDLYSSDVKMKDYAKIIAHSPVYPVIFDAQRHVLSLPPIINGDLSKISLATRNVFIECTATDLTKANVVLNTICAMFSPYCDPPNQVEQVEVVMPDGSVNVYPDLSSRVMSTHLDYVVSGTGVSIPADTVLRSLERMCLPSKLDADSKTLLVSVGPTRSDVLHGCDIMEDLAIAYGYDNIVPVMPTTATVAAPQPLSKLTDLLRFEMAMAGYTEVLTMALVSNDENFRLLRRVDDGATAASIANPKSADFQECRTSLLPGLLKTVQCNRKSPLPINIFEISDVVVLDPSTDVGARNIRRLAALHTNVNSSGFEVIHGILDRLMLLLRISPAVPPATSGYYIEQIQDPTFFSGRCARVVMNGQRIGTLGVVHPEVLRNFDLVHPASALELDIEPLL